MPSSTQWRTTPGRQSHGLTPKRSTRRCSSSSTRKCQARKLLGEESDPGGQSEEQRGGCPACQIRPGQELLDRDQGGDHRHPGDAHHTEREESRHQGPGGADAIPTLLEAHAERAGGTPPPVGDQQPAVAAVPQAPRPRPGQPREGRPPRPPPPDGAPPPPPPTARGVERAAPPP